MTLLWEWYGQIWPNLAASAITLPPAFLWHHAKIRKHIERVNNR
jgi:hypothetical protein